MQGSLDVSLPGDLTYSIKHGQDVGLLPSNFLCVLGHSIGPFDASGMLVLNKDHMKVYTRKFESVQKNLGMGTGDYGPIFKFRKVWARANAQGLLGIEAPSMTRSTVGFRTCPQIETFQSRFRKFHCQPHRLAQHFSSGRRKRECETRSHRVVRRLQFNGRVFEYAGAFDGFT